jgi:integrase
MGSIYKRGKVYWIQYYRNGKPYRETTKSKKEADAKRLLKKREGEISDGKLPGIYFDRIRFDELAEGLIRDYKLNGRKSTDRVKQAIVHLKETFQDKRVTDITTPQIEKYVEKRLDEGAAKATINRELSALRRMLNIGAKQTPPKVNRVPYIPLLKENNIKKGFFEHAEFLALRDELPDYLKGFVTFAYKTGWRLSEVTELTWNKVDLKQNNVRLEPGETKNDGGRTVYLDDELQDVFRQQWELRKMNKVLIPFVFPNRDNDDKIKSFRKTWNKACRKTGLGYGYKTTNKYVEKWEDKLSTGPTVHDFRRSACRNMIRSGVPQQVAKMVSGHKTDSVFNRYNIVSEEDLKLAAQKQESYLQAQKDTISSTIHQLATKKGGTLNG